MTGLLKQMFANKRVIECVALKTKNRFARILSSPSSRKFSKINQQKLSIFKRIQQIHPIHTTNLKFTIVPYNLSDIGEGIAEVIVKEWFVKVGDKVSQFDSICEVQSDKASVTITSRYDGIITKLYYNVDDIAAVGKPLIDVDIQDVTTKAEHNIKQEELKPIHQSAEPVLENIQSIGSRILATPAVRRVALEVGVSLKDVVGSGKHGRILKDDIFAIVSKKSPSSGLPKDEASQKEIFSNIPATKVDDKKEQIRGVRKAMFKTMTIANTIPHFVYSEEVSVSKLVEMCTQLKDVRDKTSIKITYMPFFIKAASNALLEYPILNSTLDESCEHIIYKSNHNIGVAMDTKLGLLVPNIKSVQTLDIARIAKELNRLHKLGLAGNLTPEDLSSGSFTISNIGTVGGTYTKPVILPPEVAIGAIGKIQVVPRFDKSDNLIKDKIICVSWSADHRIIDGATMARFSNLWKHYIENPTLLTINI